MKTGQEKKQRAQNATKSAVPVSGEVLERKTSNGGEAPKRRSPRKGRKKEVST